jgi:hypothetical protein
MQESKSDGGLVGTRTVKLMADKGGQRLTADLNYRRRLVFLTATK